MGDEISKPAIKVPIKQSNELPKKQPLPTLPSYNIAAMVLEFYGFDKDVQTLLQWLSHTS